MRTEVFIDAGAWVAVSYTRDQHHAAAAEIYPRLLRESLRLVTTDLVVGEAHAVLMRKVGRGPALQFLESLIKSGRVRIVHSTAELSGDALALLRRYRDHDFSYADTVSFALMRRRKIETAFAFDRNFVEAGFHVIP